MSEVNRSEMSLSENTQALLDMLDEWELAAQRKLTARVTALEESGLEESEAAQQVDEELGDLMRLIQAKRASLLENLSPGTDSQED